MASGRTSLRKALPWIALLCLVLPMFASYFFDDMFSSVSFMFSSPEANAFGWDSFAYGKYTGSYSLLCVFGGLVLCGMLLDKWGVRITGSIFVLMMTLGGALVLYALRGGLPHSTSLTLACIGCMLFGLGSEIAGTTVSRSIAKWFKGGPMALAMGLHLAIARLGTATALVLAPRIVSADASGFYPVSEASRPAAVGLALLCGGLIAWAVFVALDAMFDREAAGRDKSSQEEDSFRLSDVVKVLTNKNFILISLLCVLFYSSIIAFKKFAGSILVPRFDMNPDAAGWMVSMLPFSTVIFAPLFGLLVDKKGRGTRWMLFGACLALIAHLVLAFAPSGVPAWGYVSMICLGFAYSLVPAALWPSVPKIVPQRVLGTTFALVYWVQNLGLMAFKLLAGSLLGDNQGSGPVRVELMFVVLCALSIVIAYLLMREADSRPELGLDVPAKAS